MRGSNDLNGVAMHASDFVERRGNVETTPQTLAPLGKRFIDMLEQLQNDCFVARQPAASRSAIARAGRTATAIVKFFDSIWSIWSYLGDWKRSPVGDDLEAWQDRIHDLVVAEDAQGLEEMWFGFGIKNTMHQRVRKAIRTGEKEWGLDRLQSFWGNLDLANDLLSRY